MSTNIIIFIVVLIILVLFGGMIYYIYNNRYHLQKNPYLFCEEKRCDNMGGKTQVYNIKGNFTYDQANMICNEECGTLATKQQLIQAQKNGASWCNPGWSADQYVLYPTQENGQCNTNSVTGVNGNKQCSSKTFSANCYGPKPNNRSFKPSCPKQTKTQCKAPLRSISPFNSLKWSE